jgi:hypothetical protein
MKPKDRIPRGGIYSDPLVAKSWICLLEEVDNFMPKNPNQISSGQIPGTKKKMLAKAKAIGLKAKILIEFCKK